MESLNTESKYLRAKERVERVKKFYDKLVRAIVFIIFLGGLNYWLNEWQNPWFLWVAFGFGILIFLKALKTFELNPFLGKDWEKRKIDEYMLNKDF